MVMNARNIGWWMVWFALLAGCDTPESTQNVCQEASEHLEVCTGLQDMWEESTCSEVDAELLLDTPCEVMQSASSLPQPGKADGGSWNGESYSCYWFGIGCPVDESCAPELSQESVERLIELSNPATLQNEYDARYRVAAIADIFEKEPDPIGMFSIVYRHITNNAVWSVEEGMYEHPLWTRHLITAFAWRYLLNLHGHLTGGYVSPQWTKYYKVARNCNVGKGRTLGIAIATHLLVDLAYALDDVDSRDMHREDYMLFGEVSLWVFPDLVSDISRVYETDMSGLLRGFFLGQWIDALTSEGTATNFIYQTVRVNAWRNGRNLSKFPRWMVDADITTGWGMAEVALASLDAAGAL